MPSRS
jgi:hypothetical protein